MDGFRCLVFREGNDVDLRSRNRRPLARYFPEIVEALLALPASRFVLDGELVIAGRAGFDFAALLARLHPAASRVERLRGETPASLVAFDLLARGAQDLREQPFRERRALLARLLGDAAPPLYLTAVTDDPGQAAGWLERFQGAGIDGVVAKHVELRYEPGRRAMIKVKYERTADCWTPIAPTLVCEVAYDQVDDHRFRHPARFRRWRPDRDPSSCGLEQLEKPPVDLGELLPLP